MFAQRLCTLNLIYICLKHQPKTASNGSLGCRFAMDVLRLFRSVSVLSLDRQAGVGSWQVIPVMHEQDGKESNLAVLGPKSLETVSFSTSDMKVQLLYNNSWKRVMLRYVF